MKEPAVFIFKVADYSKPGNISVTLSLPVHRSVEAHRDLWPRISLRFEILVSYSLERPLWGTNQPTNEPNNQPTNQELTLGGNFVVAQISVPQSVALLLHMKWVRLS